MKKSKIITIGLLVAASAVLLAGCGQKNDEETGSNPDNGNGITGEHATENNTTGILEEVITDAATGAKEAATDAKDAARNMWDDVTGAAEDLKDDVTGAAQDIRSDITGAAQDMNNRATQTGTLAD